MRTLRCVLGVPLALAFASGCSWIFDADAHVGAAPPADGGRDGPAVDAPRGDSAPSDAPIASTDVDESDSGSDAGSVPCDLPAPWYSGGPGGREICPSSAMKPLITPAPGGTYRPALTVALPARSASGGGPLVMLGLVADLGRGFEAAFAYATLGTTLNAAAAFETSPGGPLIDADSFDLRVQGDCSVGWVVEGTRPAGTSDSGIHLGSADACGVPIGLRTQQAVARTETSDAQPRAAMSRSGGESLAFWTETPGPQAVVASNGGGSPMAGAAARTGSARVVGTVEPRAILDASETEVIWWRPGTFVPSVTVVLGDSRGDLGFATLDPEDDVDVVGWFTAPEDLFKLRALGIAEACESPIPEVTIPLGPAPIDVASMPGGGIVVARGGVGEIELRFFGPDLAGVSVDGSATVSIPLSGVGTVAAVAADTVAVDSDALVVVAFLDVGGSRYGYVALPIPICS